MKRIAVVLATPPGFNGGMVATELALDAFLARRGWSGLVQRYRFLRLAERFHGRPEALRRIHERGYDDAGCWSARERYDDLAASDVILYWADFLHLAQYLAALRRLADPVEKIFLLAEADDAVLARTISFGTNLLFNTARDEADPAYGVPLRRFMRGARRVWVRDALSAARVAHLRGDYRSGYFGVDCALLLRPSDVARSAGAPGAAGSVLTFFGRDRAVAAPLAELAAALGRALGAPVLSMPWGDADAFPALSAPAFPPALSETAETAAMLHALTDAGLVVTDAYHLAALAWSFGVPAVLGCGLPVEGERSVNAGAERNRRDKREVLFSQYDALEFLVRADELSERGRYERRLAALLEAARDAALCGAIAAKIRAHADAVEADLAAEIAQMLAA